MRVVNSVYGEFHAEVTHLLQEPIPTTSYSVVERRMQNNCAISLPSRFIEVFYEAYAYRFLTNLPANVPQNSFISTSVFNLFFGVRHHFRVPGSLATRNEIENRKTGPSTPCYWLTSFKIEIGIHLDGRVRIPLTEFHGINS